MDHSSWFGIVVLAILFGAPLIIGIAGRSMQPEATQPAQRLPWRLTALSTLNYTLAFNLTFFLQELFLVVPKALTPGLRPTLYHNNHDWEGSNPIENLFQGTGAAAILISGLLFAWLAKRGSGRTEGGRLFVLWMAFDGLFMALPQFVIAPLAPDSDTGRAFDYFAMGSGTEMALAGLAVLGVVLAGLFMTRRFLEMPIAPVMPSAFIFRAAVLPAIAAIPILILFRIPREWSEVIIPTIAVPLVGLSWVQASSWWIKESVPKPPAASRSLLLPALLVVALLAIFQLILRPGIRFY